MQKCTANTNKAEKVLIKNGYIHTSLTAKFFAPSIHSKTTKVFPLN